MPNSRLWFARIVTAYALAIFAFLAYLYIAEPLAHIAKFGIAATGAPESSNFLRTGPGALFAGMAIVAAWGLSRPTRLHAGLRILVLFNGCVVAVRVLGIALDGLTPLQLSELRDEGLSWLLFVAALLAHPSATDPSPRPSPWQAK